MNPKVLFLLCICVLASKHTVASAFGNQPWCWWVSGSQGASETICPNHLSVAFISPIISKTHGHQALLTYPHVGGLVGVSSFYDQFCLWRNSAGCRTQISQILPPRRADPESWAIQKACGYSKGVRVVMCPICSLSQTQRASVSSTQTAHKPRDMVCAEQSGAVVSWHSSTNAAWNHVNPRSRPVSNPSFSFTQLCSLPV